MLRIIIATGNENKVREIREIMDDPGLEIMSMAQAGICSDPEENGSTFEENALIKVRAAARQVFAREKAVPPAPGGCGESRAAAGGDGMRDTVVLADDSGLVIDALGGAPGIHSARYLGRGTDYGDKMRHILEEMRGVPEEQRGARFVCACAAAFSDGTELVVTRFMEGRIAHEIRGGNGFGYDPFFYLPSCGKTAAELTEEEKNAVSHRGKAFRAMQQRLRERAV